MKRTAVGGAFLLLAWAAATLPAPAGAAAIKIGRWQFTARIATAGSAAKPAAFGGLGDGEAAYTSCIRSDTSLPTAFGPQCRLDRAQHSGGRLSWSMTCTNSEGTVHSDGIADYHGDTMQATLVNYPSGKGGAAADGETIQHITGHYLGPCLQASDAPMSPSHLKGPAAGAGTAADTLEPPAAKAPAAPPAPPPAAARAETEAAPQERAKKHYARSHARRHYRHHGYRYYAVPGSGFAASGYGPGP